MKDPVSKRVVEYKIYTPSVKHNTTTPNNSENNIVKESNFIKGLNLSNISTPIKLNLDSSSESFCSAASVNTDHSLDDTVKIQTSTMADAKYEELSKQMEEIMRLVKANNGSSIHAEPALVPINKYFAAESELTYKDNSYSAFPSKFFGNGRKTVKTHLRDIEQWYLLSGNTTDELKIKWFNFSLAEDAATWFEMTDFYSFENLKSKFEKKFGTFRSTLEARIAFNEISIKSDERAADYHQRICSHAQAAGMSDADISDQFFRGLGTKFNPVKQTRCLYTLDQSISYLQSILDYSKETPSVSFSAYSSNNDQNSNRKSRSKSRSSSKNRNSSNSRKSSKSNSKHRSGSRSRSSSSSSKKRSATPHNVVCYNCNGNGHTANKCSSPKKQSNRSNSKNRSSNRSNNYFSVQSEEDNNHTGVDITIQPENLSDTVVYRKMTDINGKTVIVAVPDRNVNLN